MSYSLFLYLFIFKISILFICSISKRMIYIHSFITSIPPINIFNIFIFKTVIKNIELLIINKGII